MYMNNKMAISTAILLVSMVFVSGCVTQTSDNSDVTGEIIKDLDDNPEKVTVYFFWGEGCPHCAHEKPFLEQLEQKYTELEVKSFETWGNQENAKLFSDMAKAYGTSAMGVPTTFIGNFEPIVGYGSDETTGKQIEDKVIYCIEHGCKNPGEKLKEMNE